MTELPSYRINAATAPVKAEPVQDAVNTSECLYGEIVEQITRHDDWSLIRCQRDGYEGYIQNQILDNINAKHQSTTHVVHTRSTLLFAHPSLKSDVLFRLPFNARLSLIANENNQFARTDTGLFVWSDHTQPVSDSHPLNPIALARSHFLGAPYLWGGCSPAGLDCSGLVQALAQSQAITLPRDSVDQEIAIPQTISYEDRRAGDLLYWPGHTGLLVSRDRVLHATAHSLNCLEEDLDSILERTGAVSSVRRLFDS